MSWEQIFSILSIAGVAAGVGAVVVVQGMRTALSTAREVIKSLTEDVEFLRKDAKLQKEQAYTALESAKLCQEKLNRHEAQLDDLTKELRSLRLQLQEAPNGG